MSLWDKLTGKDRRQETTEDQQIERYRYLLRTAPPDQIEQAHAEAFAQLSPEQRRQVLEQLGNEVPPGERAQSDDPQALARMATRAEVRQPGTLERSFGGVGMGGVVAGSLLGSVAGAFIGTSIALSLMGAYDGDATDAQAAEGGGEAYDGGDYGSGGGGGGDYGGGGFDGGGFGGGDVGGGI